MAYGSVNYAPIFTTPGGQAFRLEKADALTHYYGYAKPGVLVSVAEWQIQKATLDGAGDIIAIEYPNGSSNYAYEWDERASYTYK